MSADASLAPRAPPGALAGSARDWARPAAILVPALIAFAFVLIAPAVLGDGDTYWHIKAGQWMLQHLAVPRTDPFTYSFAGQPWHAHEWLAEVALAIAYGLGGWSGAVILGAAAFAAAIAILARELTRRLEIPFAILALVIAAGCLAPSLLLRPHLFMTPLLALWTAVLLDARRRGRAPALGWAALILLWANLHASVVFALGLIAPFALEALFDARARPWPAVRDWGVFGIAAVIAALVTPFGLDGLLFPLKVAGMASLNTIFEWRPLDLSRLQPAEIAMAAGLMVLIARGRAVPPLRILLLLVLAYMTLAHQRHQVLLAIVGVQILAEAVGRPPQSATTPARVRALACAAAAILALGLAGYRMWQPIVRADGPVTPATALAHVPQALRARPVFNDYAMGGYLIFQGVRPFIDGRTDMYGEAFDRPYTAALDGDRAALDSLLDRYGAAWTLLTPSSPAVRVLDAEPGWRRLYADRYTVIHVRGPKP